MKTPPLLSERLNYNVSPAQAQLLRTAAQKAGEPVALFVRKAALQRAAQMRDPLKRGA